MGNDCLQRRLNLRADQRVVEVTEHLQSCHPDTWRAVAPGQHQARGKLVCRLSVVWRLAQVRPVPGFRRKEAPFVGEGVEAEVVDLRVLRPLDTATILDSVRRTHQAVVVDDGWRSGGISAEISARITEGAFFDLDAPVARVCRAEVPMPYSQHLKQAALPQPAGITQAARELVVHHG